MANAELVARTNGFHQLRDRVVELACPRAQDTVVDLGSGTGLLSLAFAARAERVYAVDKSRVMNEYLRVKAHSAGLDNLNTVLASAVSLPLVDAVADIVVSNYCLHELRHSEKRMALAEARRVLKPGGVLVVSDMMFSLNVLAPRDRGVLASKLRQLTARGLPGMWRLLKNGARLASGRWEHPASSRWWREGLLSCGFEGVSVETLMHEGGIAVASVPSGALVSTQAVAGSSGEPAQ